MKTQNNTFSFYKSWTVIILLTYFLASHSLAQSQTSGAVQDKSNTGAITGKVTDAKTGTPIIGANVYLVGTSRGDATDLDGKYRISNLEPGLYTITVSYISYAKKTVTSIEVDPDQTTSANISLQPETIGLEEITVTAEANKSVEAGLLAVQKKSVAVQDGLSAEQISKTNDGTMASVMKRIAGVSIMGNNDIYVRGLGNRYSNIQLNGAPIPSTDPNKKEAPLDIMSSSIVDNIVVQKTFTPDQGGEFSGGSVQIVTKEFPDARNFSISYSSSYNTESTLNNYLSYRGSSTDFLGYDDGLRALPDEVKDGTISSSKEAGLISSKLHNNWTPDTYTAIPSQKLSLSYANQLNDISIPVGIVSNFSFKNEIDSRSDEAYRYIQNYNPATGEVSIGANYIKNTGIQKSHMGGMLNIFAKPSPTVKIGLKNLYSNSSQDQTSIITGDFYNYSGISRQTILEFNRRSIYSSTLEFESYFNDFLDSDLEASISYSRALRDIPDRRNTQYIENTNGDFEILFADRGNLHFFSSQTDVNITGKIDYRFYPWDPLFVRVGGMTIFKDRDFNVTRLLYQDLDNSFPSYLKTGTPEQILNPQYISSGSIELVENTRSTDSYTGDHRLYAWYLTTGWDISETIETDIGIRVEHSRQQINGRRMDNLTTDDLLPAVNLTYHVSDNTKLRGAYSITLARPEFREVSNFNFRDYVGGRTVYGNPDLKRTRIFNYDIRIESYPRPAELFAASLFYKRFVNPVELFYRITQNNEVRFGNTPGANLYGFELEARKNLTGQFRMDANFSYILSEVKYENKEAVGRQANSERPMFGQSPYTLNLGAYYTLPDADIKINLNYNTFGARISAIGNAQQPGDEYEQPFHNLGLNLVKSFGNANVNLAVENILSDKITYKQGGVITNSYEIGMTFTLGITISL